MFENKPPQDRLKVKDSLYFPGKDGWKSLQVRWEIEDIINHIFPSKYQAKQHQYATKLIKEVLDKFKGLDKEEISKVRKREGIPKSTLYNLVIPKLVRFGLLVRRRKENLSQPSRGWFLILKPSVNFASRLKKLADSWEEIYLTKKEESKKRNHQAKS